MAKQTAFIRLISKKNKIKTDFKKVEVWKKECTKLKITLHCIVTQNKTPGSKFFAESSFLKK